MGHVGQVLVVVADEEVGIANHVGHDVVERVETDAGDIEAFGSRRLFAGLVFRSVCGFSQ